MEADQAMTQQAMSIDNPTPENTGDDRLFVQFYLHPRKDEAKSLEEGRAIFVDNVYVRIIIPGDKDNIVERPSNTTDQRRFPRQWLAFQANEEQPVEGTPLSEWSGVSRSQVEEMRFFGIVTVEALANMPDSQAQKFMGINMLKQKAAAFIEDASLAAPYEALTVENEQLRDQMAVMQDQINTLLASSDDGEVQDSK